MKGGWLAFFLFVWLIGAFLGSTYEYHSTESSAGMAYNIGSATFTTGSSTVVGIGTSWNNVLMAGGLIQCVDDATWYKILSVEDITHLTIAGVYAQTGGIGKSYAMAASPGWAGTGSGGYERTPISKMELLMDMSNAVQYRPILGAIPMVVPNADYFAVVYEVITWQWSFLWGSEYQMVYWIVCFPFVVVGGLSVLLLVYGVLTGNINW